MFKPSISAADDNFKRLLEEEERQKEKELNEKKKQEERDEAKRSKRKQKQQRKKDRTQGSHSQADSKANTSKRQSELPADEALEVAERANHEQQLLAEAKAASDAKVCLQLEDYSRTARKDLCSSDLHRQATASL